MTLPGRPSAVVLVHQSRVLHCLMLIRPLDPTLCLRQSDGRFASVRPLKHRCSGSGCYQPSSRSRARRARPARFGESRGPESGKGGKRCSQTKFLLSDYLGLEITAKFVKILHGAVYLQLFYGLTLYIQLSNDWTAFGLQSELAKVVKCMNHSLLLRQCISNCLMVGQYSVCPTVHGWTKYVQL